MASMTRCGTCVPPGPSRNAAVCPLTVWASEGNWERTQWRSRAVEAEVSVVGMVVIYFYHGDRTGSALVTFPWVYRLNPLSGGPDEWTQISESPRNMRLYFYGRDQRWRLDGGCGTCPRDRLET